MRMLNVIMRAPNDGSILYFISGHFQQFNGKNNAIFNSYSLICHEFSVSRSVLTETRETSEGLGDVNGDVSLLWGKVRRLPSFSLPLCLSQARSALSRASGSALRCSSPESLSSYAVAVSLGKSSGKIYCRRNSSNRSSTSPASDLRTKASNL